MNNPGMPSNVPDFVTNHLRRYLDTNGEDGHLWDSTGLGDHGEIPTLLLTITGRRTGKTVVTPLIYGESDGAYVVVGSRGGSPTHPNWYLNLVANYTRHMELRDRSLSGNSSKPGQGRLSERNALNSGI